MLRINQLKLPLDHSQKDLEAKLIKTLKISKGDLLEYRIFKRSIDARKKPQIFYVYSVDVQVRQEEPLIRRLKNKVQKVQETVYHSPAHGREILAHRPVIAGAGPAGLFCAYLLAREGYCPVLVERGAPVEERKKDVQKFWETGILDTASNVQFGEGGAGTFSDGKLNTLVKDSCGRNRFVLETFVRFGAPDSILYEQKPHVGTDILAEIVRNMREEILSLGGQIHFHSQVTDLHFCEKNGTPVLEGITLNHTTFLDTEVLVLAVGHSARDTFQMLYEKKLPIRAKSFAVGVRIEHPQEMIQISQYGPEMADALPAASYKLAEKSEDGRGVYTFCMCPGGYVVNASSEAQRLAVNGMSYHGRAGKNANSAVIVTVTPDDYGAEHPLAGVEFQRGLEEKAFRAGEGRIPVQCFGDFCRNEATVRLGEVIPQTKGAYRLANVRSIFPETLADSLEQGIHAMDRKIPGFAREDAVLSGVESRTSSPVRIERDENCESSSRGVYPCGEGAGYAGGITSAAMDGLKVAEAVIRRYQAGRQQLFTEN